MTTRARPLALGLLALGLLLLAGCDAGATERLEAGEDGVFGVALEEPVAKPDVVLTDHHGEPFDLRAETDGELTLAFFGYASCPDICPVHMANLTSVFDRLPSTITDRINVLFVTTDPARDTPEALEVFMGSFDDDFVGLTGDLDDIVGLMTALNLPRPVFEEPDDDGFYEVGHPAQVLAFLPDDDHAHYAYPWGTRQSDFTHDLRALVDGVAAARD